MTEQGTMGVVLKIDISTTLTAIVNLLEIEFPEFTKELADMTPHPTTGNVGWRERIDSGVRDLKAFTALVGWDDTEATHAEILTAFTGTAAYPMSVEDPDGQEVIAFSAHIQSIARLSVMADGYKARVMISPTGAPTIT